ncbi:cell morphogenesis las1 [Pyrenophora seminiperda CCB06]|uniref:Cell morphogenesis las1 n=1 Tax=Pyrenophora seminiperda CCB06 TaxID=1302712 RepID=A0A3M7M9M5_9PLEO|nr:cell morphogenesis las1 [Pyrenophora seminiperda CCB06]
MRLADTQIDLTRDRPSWFPSGKSLQLPLALLETRHRIVHRHLPSLAELKRAAAASLEWLWEWYWSQLDEAFKTGANASAHGGEEEDMGVESRQLVREKLQSMLKTYVKERKNEVKSKRKESKAASTALSSYNLRFSPSTTTTPSVQTQRLLLQLLVDEKMTLPTDKKLKSTMSGAFLIWSPFLLAACTNTPAEPAILTISTLIAHMMKAMNAPSASRAMVNPDLDPVREGLHDWILHILTSAEWAQARGSAAAAAAAAASTIMEDVLANCLSEPTFWNLKLAEKLLQGADVPNLQAWRAIMDAATAEANVANDDDMEVDVEGIQTAIAVGERVVKQDNGEGASEKMRGPVKVLGMWKPKPLGWLPDGWEEDE